MCGVVAVYNGEKAAEKIYLGLFALQHRGQDNAGMAVSDGQKIKLTKERGLVAEVFKPAILSELTGYMGIGHTRYPTAGDNSVVNAQPHYADTSCGRMILVSNGDVTNMFAQTRLLKKQGFTPYSSNDAELIVASIACYFEKNHDIVKAIKKMMDTVKGSYSAVLIFKNAMYVFRDPMGIRPLFLGKDGDSFSIASETCAIDTMGHTPVREIEPGELLIIKDGQLTSMQLKRTVKLAHCVFEHIYFARPDSVMFGQSVEEVRYKLGMQLAKEAPVEADFVMPVPDSSNTAALGFAAQSGIAYRQGMIRSHYIGRTFIGPSQTIRDFSIRLKFNPIRSLLHGKKIIVVDDSIVRGSTSKKIIKMLKDAGAKEVHLRIASPPIKHSCYYGIDTPRHEELIAANNSVGAIVEQLGVNSLEYLSLKGLKACLPDPQNYCFACIDGKYPIKPPVMK